MPSSDSDFDDAQTTVDPLVGLPRVGHVVADKYEVKKLVGVGGMGVVLKAWHKLLDQEVAIKVLLPELGADKEALARFEREARTVVRLKSEHVTRVFDVGRLPNKIPYMVMEFLEGVDLAELVDSTPTIPIQEAVDCIMQAAEALAEAHSLGIVHRDLKPENVFVTHRPDGTACAKVLDFGLSKAPGSGDGSGRPSRPLTAHRQVMGTPNYMSPEQWESAHDVGPETDQWALGALLYELLTGEPAFGGTELGPVCAKITTMAPTAPRALRPEIPEPLEQAVLRTLEKESARRYESLFELGQAIAPYGSRVSQLCLRRIGGLLRPGLPVEAAASAPAAPHPPAGHQLAPQLPPAGQQWAPQPLPTALATAPTAQAWPLAPAPPPPPRATPVFAVLIVSLLVAGVIVALIALLWS
ncbi:MAG: serine/threonine protein kinase, partial [Deltaproteobacteria bacterium]|nr:serine/threonine protein kinase [Deltaproteobacteria bacterium]MBW2537661.1 serine/threonine protein kinase [Deltaproteobacteria bacterium]